MVNSLEMFSGNESVNEMNAAEIKFLLLPYMLGMLWQHNSVQDRKELCGISETYFQNFIQRCFDYEITDRPPRKIEDDSEPSVNRQNPADIRAEKIRRRKEAKDLEEKVTALTSIKVHKYF